VSVGVDLSVGISTNNGQKIIRGYTKTLPIFLTIANIDPEDDIIAVSGNRLNFNISVGIFTNKTLQDCLQWLDREIEDVKLKESLARSMTTSLSINPSFIVPRSDCHQSNYICATVKPAVGASYSQGGLQAPGCLSLSAMLPCEGMLTFHYIRSDT
jgi:hypothetical protein